jgi:hypothetical protein
MPLPGRAPPSPVPLSASRRTPVVFTLLVCGDAGILCIGMQMASGVEPA